MIATDRDMDYFESSRGGAGGGGDHDPSDDMNISHSLNRTNSNEPFAYSELNPSLSSLSSTLKSSSSQSSLSSSQPSLSSQPVSLLKDHAYAWDAAVEALTRYCERATISEPILLTELRSETTDKYSPGAARMLSGALQGRVLALLSSLSNAMNILELGAFTGYSAICFAQGLDRASTTTSDDVNRADGVYSSDDMNSTVVRTTIAKRRVITCEPDIKSAKIAQEYIAKGGLGDQVSTAVML